MVRLDDKQEIIEYFKNEITQYEIIISGASISPFSSKNLPKNKEYKIPDEDQVEYKEIVQKISKNRIIELTHSTQNYLKSLVTKKNTWEDIKADMALKGLKGKEYIHNIGKWNEYIEYLNKEIKS